MFSINTHVRSHFLKIPFILLYVYVLSSCDDEGPDLAEPAEEGVSQQLILNWEKGQNKTFIATTLVDTGKKIFLLGGDTLIAETPTYRSIFTTDDQYTFYFAEHPEQLQNQTLDFSIDYLPVEVRSERWYPADEAYVDIGAGSYSNLSWKNTVNFPESPTLKQPSDGDVYNSASDRVNITWDDNLQDLENLQIWAAFDCYEESVMIYPDETDLITSNGFSISIEDLFIAVAYRSFAENNFDLTQSFIDILYYKKTNHNKYFSQPIFITLPSECNIRIHALIEQIEESNGPFSNGEVRYQRSHTKTITFSPVLR